MTADVITSLDGRSWLIDRLVVEQASFLQGKSSATLTLTLTHQRDSNIRTTVRFTGVTNLAFSQTTSNLGVVPQIVSLKDRGWEVAQYRFNDRGNDCLAFLFDHVEDDS